MNNSPTFVCRACGHRCQARLLAAFWSCCPMCRAFDWGINLPPQGPKRDVPFSLEHRG